MLSLSLLEASLPDIGLSCPPLLPSALALGGIACYFYLTRNHTYWKSQGVQGPAPLPFFGTYLEQFWRPMQDMEEQRYRTYGKIYGVYDGTVPSLVVGEPALIEEIMKGTIANTVFPNRRAVKTTHPVMSTFLSSLDGDECKRVRRIIASTFSPAKLRTIVHIMKTASVDVLRVLEVAASNRSSVNLKDLFGDYTMAVISRSAFATEPTAPFVSQASALFTFPYWRKFLDYVMPMCLLDSLGFTVLPKGPMDFFKQQTEEAICKRQNDPSKPCFDFLQLLLNAEDSDASACSRDGGKLSKDEVVGQSVLFFTVGYETSSQVLMYTAYCLALHQECQDELVRELRDARGDGDSDWDYETLLALPYLDAVVNESMRLYNPVLRMERRASVDFQLQLPDSDKQIVIPKGMIVGIPVWAIHHAEEFYPEPLSFQPERFLPENKAGILDSTFLPFGQGPRDCIGRKFAVLEIKYLLAAILPHYRFVRCSETSVPLEFVTTGRPLLGPKAVHVGVESRL